jgi:RNA recognition motif-containing protein
MTSSDEQSDKDCPLCMEALEIDDLNFYPCECKYQICRFCWHRIRTDENGLCPACRQQYPEDPVNFKPLTSEELQRIKSEKRKKEQKEKQKVSESRKHLANLRVIQDNLVYVIGLSGRIADAEVLKKTEYFGKYGKIVKVVVSTSVGGQQQTTSNTAYVTYVKAEDALRAIQSVNNCQVDSRTVRASLGTTKYCSCFLRNLPCHKQECMYLHDVANSEASFTKEDMQQGKHTEYERRLSDRVLNPQPTVPQAHARTSGRSVSPVRVISKENYGDEENATSNRCARLHNSTAPRHRRAQQRARSGSTERVSDYGSVERDHQPEPPPQPFTCIQDQNLSHSCSDSTDHLDVIPPAPGLSAPDVDAADTWSSRMLTGWPMESHSHSGSGLFTTPSAAHTPTAFPDPVPTNHAHTSSALSAVLAACAPPGVPQLINGQHKHLINAGGDGSRQQTVVDTVGMFSDLSAAVSQHKHTQQQQHHHHQQHNHIVQASHQQPMVTDWQAAFGLKPVADSTTLSTHALISGSTSHTASHSTSSSEHTNTQMDDLAALIFAGGTVANNLGLGRRASENEDDLGFDPISESSKGLLDLIEQEKRAAMNWTNAALTSSLATDLPPLHSDEHERIVATSLSGTAPQSQLHKWRQQPVNMNWSHMNGTDTSHLLASQHSTISNTCNTTAGGNAGGGSAGIRPMHAHSPFTTPPPQFQSPNSANSHELQSPFGPKFFGSPPNGGGIMNGHIMHDKNGMAPSGAPHFNGLRMPPMNRHNMPPRPPHHNNMPHLPPPPGLRAPPPHMPMPPPPPNAQHTPHGSISPHHHLKHSSNTHDNPFSLTEWQEGLKSLLPNVNIHFAPGLQAPPHSAANSNSQTSHPPPPPSGGVWRGQSNGMPPHGSQQQQQYMQAPPPLQMPPNNMHIPPMRPSPPGRSPPDHHSQHAPFGVPQAPFNRPMHPHMFPPQHAGAGPWSSVTPPPPPPGFSPGSAGNHRPM